MIATGSSLMRRGRLSTTGLSQLDEAAAWTIAEAPQARQSNPIMLVAALHADLSSQIGAGVLVNGR
jgi:hypothetical protein